MLHGNAVTVPKQHASEDIERLLRAIRHRHILARSDHAAREPDMPRNRLAQLRMTGGMTVIRQQRGLERALPGLSNAAMCGAETERRPEARCGSQRAQYRKSEAVQTN